MTVGNTAWPDFDLSDEESRNVAAYAAACARQALPLFETDQPNDRRPRTAINRRRPSPVGIGVRRNSDPQHGLLLRQHAQHQLPMPDAAQALAQGFD